MTTAAKSAAPPTAIKVWCDGLYLFAEVPGDPPYIHTESVCEAGLWKMLNLLRQKATEANVASFRIPDTTFQPKPAKPPVGTKTQRAKALDVLKRLGMV